MLFAFEITHEAVQALKDVALVAIAAWVTIKTRQLDSRAQKTEQKQEVDHQHIQAIAQKVDVPVPPTSGTESGAPGK